MQHPVIAYREKKQMSRRKMSRVIGMSYHTLCHIEAGLPLSLREKTLERLSKLLGLSTYSIQAQYRAWRRTLEEK